MPTLRIYRVILLVLLQASAVGAALGQATPAELFGRVSDGTGAPISGAVVSLTFSSGDSSHQAKTDAHGIFRFENIKPGTYSLEVAATSFRPYRLQLDVSSGSTRRVDVALDIAPLVTTIEVRENDEDVRLQVERDYEATKSVTSLDGDALIRNNPISNYDALRYLPGIMNAASGGRDRFSTPTHIRGAVSWGHAETLDDYPAVDIVPVSAEDGGYTASLSTVVPSLAIQDLKLSTGGLGVSYGQAAGGVVRSFIKRGDPNDPHATIRVEGVSIGEVLVTGDVSGGSDKFDYYFSGQGVGGDYGDAFETYARPIESLRLGSGLAKIGFEPTSKGRLEILFLGGDERHDYFQNRTLADENREIRHEFHTDKSNYFTAGRYDYRASERLAFGLGLTHSRFHENRIEESSDGVPVGLSRRNRPQRSTVGFANMNWRTPLSESVSYTGEVGTQFNWDRFEDITGNPVRFSFAERAVYVRNSLVWDRGLTLNGGVRTSQIDNGFRDFNQNAYDVGIGWRFPTRTSLWASHSTGYKLNKAFYLFWGGGGFIRRDPPEGLEPATSHTSEFGVEQTILSGPNTSGLVRASYFKTDEIGLFNFGNSGTGIPYHDDARIKGFEFWTQWQFWRLRPFASFTYLDNVRTSSTNPAASNIDLRWVTVPSKAAGFGSYIDAAQRLTLTVLGYYDSGGLSEQFVNDDLIVTRHGSFVRVNAAARYDLNDRFSLTLRTENLFNQKDLGYSRSILQADGSSEQLEGTQRDPGLTVAAGFEVRF